MVLAAYVQFRPRNLRRRCQVPFPLGLNFQVFRGPSQARSWEFLTSLRQRPMIVRFRHCMRVNTTET